MLLLDLRDGTSIAITDHDKPLDFDIGDGVETYDASTGISMSNLSLSCGLDADNFEVTGPISDLVTLDAILGGRFNRAVARRFQVNWSDLTQGAIKLLKGKVTEPRVEGGSFTMEVRSDVDFLNQTVGRVITNQCDSDYANGTTCQAIATSIVGTVTAVTDALRFTVSFAGAYADDLFNKGTVEALTGALAGTLKVEIEDWTAAGAITLFAPLVEAPAIGDTFTIKDGCGKSRADCMAHNAIQYFRGYPEVPGTDQVLRSPIPGEEA